MAYPPKVKPAKPYRIGDATPAPSYVAPKVSLKPKKKKSKIDNKIIYPTRSGNSKSSFDYDLKWWEADEGCAHDFVYPLVRGIKNRQALRRFQLGVHFQAYANFGQQNNLRFFSSRTSAPLRITVNLIKSCVDTATARIAKSKPRVFILPIKGDYVLERKAKDLQKFLDGQFDASNVYENLQEVFRDACIYGNGALYLYSDGNEIKSEQVKIDELIVDEIDAAYGDPQMMYREHWVSKAKLIDLYPEHEEEIERANMLMRKDIGFVNRGEWITVIEAWRKPSTPKSTDGKHVICINNATLLEEEWKKDYFPIINFCWTTPLSGFWGQGIALELESLQFQINQTMSRIQKSLAFYAVPRIFIDAQSQLTSQLVNDITVNKYSGSPPVFLTPTAMASDVYSYVQWQYQLAFQQVGLSQLSAQSEKPAGIDSAVALRTYQDVETQRFAIVGQRWERKHVEVARIMIDMASELYGKKGKTMKVSGRGFIENIDWKNASLSTDKYNIRAFPTNLLPSEPTGKIAAAQDYAKAGLLPPDVIADQMDLPILNDWVRDTVASRENVKRVISKILNEGKYIAPEGLLDLPKAIALVGARILEAECDDVDPDRIDMLRRFWTEAKNLLASANQPPPGMAPPGAPLPTGNAPPPTPPPGM